MSKKIDLFELVSLFSLCMVIEFCVLYFIIYVPIDFFKIFGIKYSIQIDLLRASIIHFIMHNFLNVLARRFLKTDYKRYRIAMLASISTFTVLSIPMLFTEWGPFIIFFAVPCTGLLSYLVLFGIEKVFLDKKVAQ